MRFSHVLNVIAQDAGRLAARLRSFGELAWLAEGRAFDIGFDGDPAAVLKTARAAAGDLATELKADINVVACQGRRKKLLVSDMESTIVSCECLDELAAIAGIGPKIAAITERAMRGEIAFEGALRERVALLKGLPVTALEEVYREKVKLIGGARELVATMKANGARTLLVSGGFTWFTGRVKDAAGFDEHQSNTLHDDGKVLSGTVGEPILGREAKLEALKRALAEQEFAPAAAIAIGDGANDLAMIRYAGENGGLGIAFHAKPLVAEAAGTSIAHNDLKAVLYLQGYCEGEIVTPPPPKPEPPVYKL
ncbi:phosphoserine phosphatase SerB [Rhizomicrobium electricum]|jgi:phosphoserine phosphatase|uniref:Phosphoserine phosphatase n=1 Tax=Rhizomicrobium electricum TaxID=480070 RepID=A0ABN1EG03_9PROT|nr:phosphoserine phosphatase SerB [Rhizomicrobium electricum]NIJ48554.1 phosphoserine phosphatase [Rhizomicrobium electricum]